MDRHLKTLSLFVILFFSSAIIVHSQEHSLVKIWSSDTVLKVPESVLYDAENKVLYASNIDGKDPWAAD